MKKTLLPIVLGLAVIALYHLSGYFQSKSVHFFGIADDREQMISFQYPVKIVDVFAVEGEKVHQGKHILEVRREDLASKLGIVGEQIRTLESKDDESIQSILSKINSLNAEKQAESANIDLQIHQIELRMDQNLALLEGISGSDASLSAFNDPGFVEIDDLEKKRRFMMKAIDAQVGHLSFQLNSKNRPVDSRIAEFKERKVELERQGSDLIVEAKFTGRISTVNYKPGELVPPFRPVMSVHSLVPRYIKGYIHENILNDVKIGQKVWVESTTLSRKDKLISGIVESLGNRIVEYPVRLKKNPAVPSWGREVVVRLGRHHSLLFGEKVDVLTERPMTIAQRFNRLRGRADAKPAPEINGKRIIRSDDPAMPDTLIEASGILWNEGKGHYLLVSDEEVSKNPAVFLMNQNGDLNGRLLFLEDTRIDDIESIGQQGDAIFIAASLSHNRKDRLKSKRKKLIRFKYEGHKVSIQDEIDLYDVLNQVVKRDSPPEVTRFLMDGINQHSMDIEALAVKGNDLYLGFKAPLDRRGNTVILRLSDITKMFSGKQVETTLWRTIRILDPETGEPSHLSDMMILEDGLLLTSVTRSSLGLRSYLWRYRFKDEKLQQLKLFSGLQAEGIASSADGKSLMVVFDQGGEPASEYQLIPFSFN